ncbi:MAG: hypothetical protein U9P50_00335, partial [Patescibacteria group bacterium]|nr:hypothetical protein [Patescibacteria group bacterium]
FELKQKKNKFIEEAYKDSMKELNVFYEINWVRNMPKVFILKSRQEINAIRAEKTRDWVTGWVDGFNTLYVLDIVKIKTESSHKKGYSKKEYVALIKHELSHLFSNVLVRSGYQPTWLWEGTATYTAGQDEFKVKPEKFGQFLYFYEQHVKGKQTVYYESGFFVGMLVEKFGKKKFLNFLKSLQKIKNRKEFDALFLKTYKFKLSYQEINRIYKNKL